MEVLVISKHKKIPDNARELALDILTRVDKEGAYSNLLLHQTLLRANLSRSDASLVTELVYGSIQRKNTIDYFLNRFVKGGLRKLQPWVLNLLRLSFYQLHYLDRIPAHAAVNEGVRIAKQKGHKGISGLVNGVLRNVIRQQDDMKIPKTFQGAERVALQHSHPEWLVRQWVKDYGEDIAQRICLANNEPPKTSVRVNVMRRSRGELLDEMTGQGLQAEPSALSSAGIVVHNGGNMALTSWYKAGELSIQDESSMLVAEWVEALPGMKVLDACAAPGGKTSHIAETMKDDGTIVACDLHSHKARLIEEQAHRLQLHSIETVIQDARSLGQLYAESSFDRILLDAPCTGLGVIRRKPELKWTKSEEDVQAIADIQGDLLEAVSPLLKPGGLLVYSTCTIGRTENEEQVEKFLLNHSDFSVEPPGHERFGDAAANGMLQIFPYQYDSDGFFIARLRKRG